MRKLLKITFCFMLAVAFVTLPTKVEAATLQDYIDKLERYRQEVATAQDKIDQTQSQINATKAEIEQINAEMKQMVEDIERMHQEIEEYNEEIKDKSLQTKQLFQYLQVSEGENVYLEYIFGADNITDLIYRMSIVEQLTAYNEQTIDTLEEMIEANKAREKELNAKEVELEEEKVVLSNKISSLEGEKISINAGAISSREQLEIYEDMVQNFRDLGCGTTDVIGVDCAKNVSVSGFYRPITQGYITGYMGYRDIVIAGNNFHLGLDMSSANKRSERVYPIAAGKIQRIYKDSYGAKIVLIYHYDANTGKNYTSQYMHLSEWSPNIYEGQTITPDQYLGYMGDTGFAFGVHLHLEVADCRLYDLADPNCSRWTPYAAYVERRYHEGFHGAVSLIDFPSQWWSR